MAPIRIGIIGLSAKPGAWAALAHFPRLAISPNFEIVAMCNSSLESTRAAIKAHNLPSTVRAYDSYDKIAADSGIDLFVVSTRVDSHAEIVIPALNAGRNVFVEWPLAVSTEEARRIANLAKEKGVKTLIGFQARASPTIRKVKELIDSGTLGDIHSVNYQGAINIWQDNIASERYSHFLSRRIGANPLTIYGGHTLDAIFFSLGELKAGEYNIHTANLRPKMQLKQTNGLISDELYEKDTPDQMLLQGVLDREPPTVFSFHLRGGPRFQGLPGSTWRIYGTKAELVVEFTSAGPQMAMASSIQLYDFAEQTATEVRVDQGGKEWTELPSQGQNLGHLYEAYAEGHGYADFDLAVRRHELLDEFWATMER